MKISSNSLKNQSINLEKIENLDQWKSAKNLSIDNFILEISLEKLFHFSFLEVKLKNVAAEILLDLRNKFLESTDPKEFIFTFVEMKNQEKILEFFGFPEILKNIFGQESQRWKLQYPGNEKVLEIQISKNWCKFTNIESFEEQMPLAYNWLTNLQKNIITEIHLKTSHDKIVLSPKWKLFPGMTSEITYIRNGSDTLVTFEKNEQLVENQYVDVFLEDLKMFLTNQETLLDWFCIVLRGSNEDSTKICENLEEILKARSSPLKIDVMAFSGTTVTSGFSIIQYLNSDDLSTVFFREPAEPVNFSDFVIGLRGLEKDRYRFALYVTVRKIDEQDLQSINELSSCSESFHHLVIDTFSLECQNYRSILSDKFDIWNEDGIWIIEYKDKKLRLPILEETPVGPSMCELTVRSVLENPLLMKLLMKQLNYFDIEKLGKVNRGVRKCIDDLKHDPHLEKYSILFQSVNGYISGLKTRIELKSGDCKEIKYGSNGNGGGPISNCRDIFLNDFENTLRNQKSCIRELSITYECPNLFFHENLGNYKEMLSELGTILKKREAPLKFQKISIESNSQAEVMEILPAIHTGSLKIIEILAPFNEIAREPEPFEVDQLSKTNQWNNAEQLTISKYFAIRMPIREINILNFANLEILVKFISSDDVFYLKTNLLKSSKFRKFKIFFRESAIDESVETLIGEPYATGVNQRKIWYFRIPNTDSYLHTVLQAYNDDLQSNIIVFTRVAQEDTPFFN
ncbi:unnamed protein product [Caenorhabditis nigoni]